MKPTILPEYFLNSTYILPEYYLKLFRNFMIVGEVLGGREEVYNNASLTALSLFETDDTHYMYIGGPEFIQNRWCKLYVHNVQERDESAMDGGGSVHNTKHAHGEDLDRSAMEELDDELCFERIL